MFFIQSDTATAKATTADQAQSIAKDWVEMNRRNVRIQKTDGSGTILETWYF
jgi:hypothetical protein